MIILCAQCGDEFQTEARIRVDRDWRSDSEERVEVPAETICPDCREESGEVEGEDVEDDE